MLKLLKQMIKREYGMVLVSLVFIVAQVWLDLKMPEYMSTITKLTMMFIMLPLCSPWKKAEAKNIFATISDIVPKNFV